MPMYERAANTARERAEAAAVRSPGGTAITYGLLVLAEAVRDGCAMVAQSIASLKPPEGSTKWDRPDSGG